MIQVSQNIQSFGFQNIKNTNDAIFNILYKVYFRIDGGEAVDAMLCDFSKGFYHVDYKLLLEKLNYGFRRLSHQWNQSYLPNRN